MRILKRTKPARQPAVEQQLIRLLTEIRITDVSLAETGANRPKWIEFVVVNFVASLGSIGPQLHHASATASLQQFKNFNRSSTILNIYECKFEIQIQLSFKNINTIVLKRLLVRDTNMAFYNVRLDLVNTFIFYPGTKRAPSKGHRSPFQCCSLLRGNVFLRSVYVWQIY